MKVAALHKLYHCLRLLPVREKESVDGGQWFKSDLYVTFLGALGGKSFVVCRICKNEVV